MKLLITCSLVLATAAAFAQNTGIGTTNPLATLHIQNQDTTSLVLDNNRALAGGLKTALYFKNSNYFTGGLASIGTSTNAARISIFSFASPSISGLREHFSVTDNGYVGIGVTNPTSSLQVKYNSNAGGNARFDGSTLQSLFNFGSNEVTYLRGGREGAPVYINDLGAGDVYIADGGGDVNLARGTGTVNIGAPGNLGAIPLVVNGHLKMTGGNPGVGKVLTSDATGNASWQSPSGSSNYAFSAIITTNLTLTNNVEVVAAPYTEEFDEGNMFNPTTGVFTVPVDGVYQLGYNMVFRETGTDTKYLTINVTRNGGYWKSFFHVSPGINSNWTNSYTNEITARLTAGQQFRVTVTRSAAANNVLAGGTSNAGASYFSAVLLYR